MPYAAPSLFAPERKQPSPDRAARQKLYGTQRWKNARRLHLARHPLCVECERAGHVTAATTVDHIRPHRGDLALFWDASNWQSLCTSHHNAKAARGE